MIHIPDQHLFSAGCSHIGVPFIETQRSPRRLWYGSVNLCEINLLLPKIISADDPFENDDECRRYSRQAENDQPSLIPDQNAYPGNSSRKHQVCQKSQREAGKGKPEGGALDDCDEPGGMPNIEPVSRRFTEAVQVEIDRDTHQQGSMTPVATMARTKLDLNI